MKKRSAVLILMVLISSVYLKPAIPVVDWSALAQRVLHASKTLAQWYQYIEKYKQFHNEFKRYRYAFLTIYRGFENLSSIHDLFVNVNRVDNFIQMVYYDQNKIDTWSGIFRELIGLEDKYQAIQDTSYITKNQLYKNPDIKEQLDQAAVDLAERLQEIKGGIELAKHYRRSEEETLEQIKLLQDKVGEFATEGGETNDGTLTAEYAKIMHLNGLIRLQALRVEAEIASLLRLQYERQVKEEARAINQANLVGRQKAREAKNYQLISD